MTQSTTYLEDSCPTTDTHMLLALSFLHRNQKSESAQMTIDRKCSPNPLS